MQYYFGNKYGNIIINHIQNNLSFNINPKIKLPYILINGLLDNQSNQYYQILYNFQNYITVTMGYVNKGKIRRNYLKYFVLIIIHILIPQDT